MLTEENKEIRNMFSCSCMCCQERMSSENNVIKIQFINGLDQSKQNSWLLVAGCERVLLPVLLQSSDIARLFPSSDLLQTS